MPARQIQQDRTKQEHAGGRGTSDASFTDKPVKANRFCRIKGFSNRLKGKRQDLIQTDSKARAKTITQSNPKTARRFQLQLECPLAPAFIFKGQFSV